MSRETHVYWLVDGDGEVRYVGQSECPHRRLHGHLAVGRRHLRRLSERAYGGGQLPLPFPDLAPEPAALKPGRSRDATTLAQWIAGLLAAGERPRLELVECRRCSGCGCSPAAECAWALAREALWIDRLGAGGHRLLNRVRPVAAGARRRGADFSRLPVLGEERRGARPA